MPHIHEKIDFTVEVFIVHKNKVLLRKHDKYKIWLSVGGHVELDEEPNQAVSREAKEEVGLDIKITGSKPMPDEINDKFKYRHLFAPRYMDIHHVNDTHQHVVLVYFATSDTDKVSEPQNAHERTEIRWVTREELKSMDLRPNVLFYATQALEELAGK